MSFSADFLDQLRARVRLSDVIGRHVKLTARGGEHIGLCPFHNEKTPSFTLNDGKGLYYCFGCGAKGDAIDFVRQQGNLPFQEAVAQLAAMVGMAIPQQENTQESPYQHLYAILEKATQWYQAQLSAGKLRAEAHAYLLARGLSEETIQAFRIGFAPAPPHTTVVQMLRGEGVSTEDLLTSGLLGQSEREDANLRSSGMYERFRNRIIFPIMDSRRRVIGFGGRALGQDMPKYLNSSDGPLFHKGQILYHFSEAREAARKGNPVILVEGYMDVIALQQAGFRGAVAPLGTAVTLPQLELLWSINQTPIVCLDGDAAGQRAMHRVIDLAIPHLAATKTLSFVTMPVGHDPDSFLRMVGKEAWDALLAGAMPLCDVLWESVVRDCPITTPEQRAKFRTVVRERVARIQDKIVREEYQRDMAARINLLFEAQRSSAYKGRQETPQRHLRTKPVALMSPNGRKSQATGLGGEVLAKNHDLQRKILMAALVMRPELFSEVGEIFAGLTLASPLLTSVQQAIVAYFFSQSNLDKQNLRHHLCDLGFSEALRLLDDPQVVLHCRFARLEASKDKVLASWREIYAMTHEADGMAQDLQAAAAALKSEFTHEAWQRYKALRAMSSEENDL